MAEKILLALSGGVDSSVAAMILQKQGYEVIGAFMKNWSDTKNKITGECQWKEERRYAEKVSALLGIKLITLDFESQYKKQVVDKMFLKYKKGITPNPDVDCNREIKFPMLIKAAKKLGINLVATGHYIRKKQNKNGKWELLRAKDEMKDQSYFLYMLKQNEIKNCLFPIGDYTKTQVREIAEKNNFPNFNKKGTVGICFIGKINLKDFLEKKIKNKKGKIIDPNGNVVGEHDGIFYYTIGQRIGPRFDLNITHESEKGQDYKRWYVAKKNAKKNILVVAPEGHEILLRKNMIVKNLYLIDEDKKEYKKRSKNVLVRIRQVGELLPGKLFYENNRFKVVLENAIKGISDGQAIVIYSGEKVLGGGEISS
jgi:tRNA-specific 2-thiouridylase